ncbi:MAG TPA: wax ester/triacylglycerol synthase family O-acyltransferase [Acidimicrobiales bacterium]|jgi:diacylglycerol O-acyltransferase
MDRLSPLDSLFLHVEDGITHMHIASCATFEGPAPGYADFVALLASKLPVLGRYRQKVRFVPGQLGRPVWVDDPHFNLAYHVRHTALPPPGGEPELNNLMSWLMSVELDRRRPLWEAWMVEGLTENRWAMISKVHHCMVDGISGTDLMVLLLDPAREHTPPPADTWTPEPEPSDMTLLVSALRDLLLTPAEQLRAARSLLRRPGAGLTALVDSVQGAVALGRELVPAPALSIEGPIGPQRRWAAGRASLDDLKQIRGVFGGTVNDVVLAVIAGAFRDLLVARGDPVDHAVVRSLVPVSVRATDDHTANNQVSASIAELPIGVADPVERLEATRRQMDALKASHQADASSAMNSMAAFSPPMLYALGLRSGTTAARHVPQRSVTTVTTNVPGPRDPLYALGREMLEYLPFVPLSQGVRIGVSILSYNGKVRFGVTGDYDTMPEVDWFCHRIEAGVAELVQLAGAGADTIHRSSCA